jgi:hypothetical protein
VWRSLALPLLHASCWESGIVCKAPARVKFTVMMSSSQLVIGINACPQASKQG